LVRARFKTRHLAGAIGDGLQRPSYWMIPFLRA